MVNQREEEQLRSQGVPNIILIIKGKASGLPRCTSQCSSSVAGSGFNFFIDRGVGRMNWREDILSSMIKSKGRMNWKHWLVWSFLIPSHFMNYCFHAIGFYFFNWSIANKLKKYCRTPRDPRCNSNSDNLSSPLIETISLGFFSHFYSANSILDNSNFSLTRTKFHFIYLDPNLPR